MRFWKTPIVYRGKPVWIAHASTRLGGRFSKKSARYVTTPVDPYVDLTRNDVTQNLVYSQSLAKIGYVKGAALSEHAQNKAVQKSAPGYVTDGLRVVLLFGHRPVSIDDIDFFEWERLSDYQ